MLRIEKHFEKKLNKIAAANQEAEAEAEGGQTKTNKIKRSSSSLNTMRFTQL